MSQAHERNVGFLDILRQMHTLNGTNPKVEQIPLSHVKTKTEFCQEK